MCGSLEKVACVVTPWVFFSEVFSMVRVHWQQLYCRLWQPARAPSGSPRHLYFSFWTKIFIQYHTVIFLSSFSIGAWTHNTCLHIHLFMSVCIRWNTENLDNVLTSSRYLVLFCLNGLVCTFLAWKIKHKLGGVSSKSKLI